MITKQQFITAMTYLKAFYLNWEFDIENKGLLQVWYNELKDMNIAELEWCLNSYMKKRKSPPSNPTHLKDFKPETKWWQHYMETYCPNLAPNKLFKLGVGDNKQIETKVQESKRIGDMTPKELQAMGIEHYGKEKN